MADVTPREREIGTLIAQGKTNPEIAEVLGVSVSTVDNHRRALYSKVGVRNSVELTHHAIRHGWVRVKGMPGRPRKVSGLGTRSKAAREADDDQLDT